MARLEKHGTQEAGQAKPPKRGDVLFQIVSSGHRSRMEPEDIWQAVNWYSSLFESQRPEESQREVATRGGSRKWSDPYLERMAYLVTRFRSLSNADQGYVVTAAEEGIPWRGDVMPAFREVVRHARYMTKAGREEFIAKAQKKFGGVCPEAFQEGGVGGDKARRADLGGVPQGNEMERLYADGGKA